MKNSLRSFLAIGTAVAASGTSLAGDPGGALLYDIDFSEPFHTFGAVTTLDEGGPTPRQGFSEILRFDPGDEPRTDGAFDLRSMTDGVVRFGGDAQARLNLESGDFPIPGADYDIYTLEFQAALPDSASMTLFFDASAINRFSMGKASPSDDFGVISDGSGPGSGTQLAVYTPGELLAVRVTFDTVNERWRVEVDGETLIQGPTQNAVTIVRNIRFVGNGDAYFDNIKVWGSFIECGDADLNDDGILDLSDVNAFVSSFLDGCGG
jgi:hypothetical protein